MEETNGISPEPNKSLSFWAVLALALPLLALVFLFWLNATPLHLLAAWILSVACSLWAVRRLKQIPDAFPNLRIARAGLALSILLPVLLMVLGIPLTVSQIRSPDPLYHESMNIRQIGQASLIYAFDHRDNLPPVTVPTPDGETPATLHHVAFLLAKHGGLNDPDIWIYRHDRQDFDWNAVRTVMNGDRTGLNPRFAEVDKLLVDYVTGLNTRHPSTTPIAWTRGLREDGTWDRDGVFGGRGGHIVFMGGNVRFQKNLHGDNQLLRPDGTRTSNILETLPPGTRVVGQGPASLHGRVSPNKILPDAH